MISNEEKTKQIISPYNYTNSVPGFKVKGFVHDRVMEMANWKDKQAKAVLDDLRKEFAGEGYGSARWLLSEVEKRLGL